MADKIRLQSVPKWTHYCESCGEVCIHWDDDIIEHECENPEDLDE